MDDLGIRIEITDALLDGTSEVVSVASDLLGGVFKISPFDDNDFEQLAAAHGYCKHCDGRGWVPVPFGGGMRTATCPRCKGKSTSADDPVLRRACLDTFCHGWDGWTTKSGRPIPDNDDVRNRVICRDSQVFGAIRGLAFELKKKFTDELGKARPAGPAPSPAASQPPTSSPSLSVEG